MLITYASVITLTTAYHLERLHTFSGGLFFGEEVMFSKEKEKKKNEAAEVHLF